ncbi:MAG: DUF3822 family protein [Bacteroidales bacterium]|nr:DUF3822 family protein [Bacteroidales bacterium]MBO6221883.1 DUF3822 family protein [Bacteroidales bacterium]
MSRHTPKVALVPSGFFDPASAREVLSRTASLDEEDKVEYISLPEYSAELVYSLSASSPSQTDLSSSDAPFTQSEAKDLLPELYYLLKKLPELKDYNKIAASYGDGVLSLAIAQGENLLLANTFQAADFTTAEYFLFMAVRKLQLNPEVSTIHFMTPLSGEEEMSLYRYFKTVETV